MGSETVTYKDLQIQPLMEHPEKAYKQYMLEAFKQIRQGMRVVNANYLTGIIDTRSLFNDGFLTNLGYNPSESITYTLLDPALVLSWLRTNISPAIENNVSASWRAPTLFEIAMEYLQDTYSGFILAERSFLSDGVRWYITGVVSTSSSTTDVTCYKEMWATVTASIPVDQIKSADPTMYKDSGGNYWKVTKKEIIIPEVVNPDGTITPGFVIPEETVHIAVVYMTIQCPGVTNDVVQASVDRYNNSIQTSIYQSEPDPESGTISGWEATVRMSVYIDDSGEIVVTGSIVTFNSFNIWGGSYTLDAQRAAIADAVDKVTTLIEKEIGSNLQRLVAHYTVAGEQKIVIAEIPRALVSIYANAKAFPIIPLKDKFGFVNESRGMKVVLNKIGMNNGDFKDSLADKHIKNAALMFILNLNDNNPAVVKAIYETLINIVQTTSPGYRGRLTGYQLSLAYTQVNFKTNVVFTTETINGSIGPIGTYTVETKTIRIPGFSNGDITEPDRYEHYKVICKQLTEDYYEELELSPKSSTLWVVGGHTLDSKFKQKFSNNLDLSEVYIPIVDIGLKSLNYRELHYVLARSLSLMVLSIVVVKSKWYQTMFFKAIMFVVIVVIIYFTGGVLMGLLSFLGLFGIDLGVFGQILTVVMAIYTMGASLAANGYALASSTLLTGAQTLTSLASVASEISVKGAMKALEDKANETRALMAESEKLIDEIAESTQQGLWMGIDDRLPDMLYLMSSTEVMCNNDILYDYDSVMDNQIRSVGI